MGTATGLTAAAMAEIRDAQIVDAQMDANGHLIFTNAGGQAIDVGYIVGPEGPMGPGGPITKVNGKTGSEVTITAEDIGSVSAADLKALVPPGTIITSAASATPNGYLPCAGGAYKRTDYPSLYGALGTAYGAGDNSTTFNVPNLKGKVVVARDGGDSDFDTLGETGGSKTHNHGVSNAFALLAVLSDRIRGSFRGASKYDVNRQVTNVSGATAAGVSAEEAIRLDGSTDGTNGMPPYIVLNYFIKV